MTTQPRSALITHYADGGETFGVSGILLSDDGGGWLLSHGSLLAPAFLEKPRHDVRHFLEGELRRLEMEIVEVPRKVARSMRFRVKLKEGSRDSDCSLRYVWRCGLLRKTFNELLFSWSFEKLAKLDKSLLSIFVLLKVDPGNSGVSGSEEGRQVLSDFYTAHIATSIPRPRRGVMVEIESAPFGTAAFLGSVSRGIVSNVIGERGCLVLADANAVPGCEGAPVFLMDDLMDRQIGGMVVAVLSWCRGEWVDYTFAANLQPCLARILGKDGRVDTKMLLPDVLDRSVVVVKCGSGWGTGVIVDAATGTIVTCSHVVREAPGSRIRIVLANSSHSIDDDDDNSNDGGKVWARLVYRTRDGQPYDVAVLRLEQRHEGLVALPLASKLPDKGTAVLAAGYPFFGAGLPSLSSGVVSRRTPSVLQTTCCVQSGASGGPVVDARTGEMLGLVVSNAVAAGTRENGYKGTLYPRFNMAVPALVLRQPLLAFVKSGDARCLESLSSSDPEVLETWNFYLSPRSKM